MKKALIFLGTAAVSAALSGWVIAADSVSVGKNEFRNSCALCHGSDAKGTGGVADLLKKSPPDLTMLAKNNAGKFPADRVTAMIDGRELVKGHGDRDMPAWGDRYSKDGVKAAAYYGDMPYKDTEKFVKSRISSLMEFLKSIQAK